MKKEITKHEWDIIPRSSATCKHCGTVRKPVNVSAIKRITNKEVGRYIYYKDGATFTVLPKCITRKTTGKEDGNDGSHN